MDTRAPANQTLTEHVIQQLLDYVKEHNLQPGELLPTEVELATLLGVSRVALREALCHFKALGIITSRRGSGLRVAKVDLAGILERVLRHLITPEAGSLRELLTLRRTLELGSIADAVEKTTPKDLEAIEEAYGNFERLVSNRHEQTTPEAAGFQEAVDQAEIDFHTAIMAPGECRLLGVVLAAMRIFFQQRNPQNGEAGMYEAEHLRKICNEHFLIVSAFRVQSSESAYFALRRHLSY